MGNLTTAQAGEALGISRRRVLALINAGRLPAAKLGRDWLVQEKDLAKVQTRTPGRPKAAATPAAARRRRRTSGAPPK